MDQVSNSAPASGVGRRRFERIGLTLVVLLCLCRWISVEWRLVEQSIRASFAVEQTEIFEYLLELDESPAEIVTGINGYYPSDTKQVASSRLDQLVERCRRLAIRLANCDCVTAPAVREPKE